MKPWAIVIALAAAIILQATLVPYMAVRWFRPDLPLLVLVFVATRRGPLAGVVAGFLTGIAADAVGTDFFGLSSFAYSLAAFAAGKLYRSDSRLSVFAWAKASGLAALLYGTVYAAIYTLGEAPPFQRILLVHALPTAIYTWALGMLWALSPLYGTRRRVHLGG